MKWKKYTIETTTEAEDYMAGMLMELGIEGIEIEDNMPLTDLDQSDMFIDVLPELPPDDGISHVSFYIEVAGDTVASDDFRDAFEDVASEALLNTGKEILPPAGMSEEEQKLLLIKVKEALEELRETVDIGSGTITSSETEDLDWINNWKNYFKSFYIGDLLIKPSWEEIKPEDMDKPVVEIDPGLSFGTGKHETTQLCIKQLLKYGKNSPKVLDIGCGSGILSIVALKIGAREVVGTDLDKDCMTSTRANMEVNKLDVNLGHFYVGNLIDDVELQKKVGTEEYDIVVANILADVLIPMAPVIPDRLKKGGYFITSGIIDFRENDVKKAIEVAGLKIIEVNYQGEWVNITARKE